MTDQRFPIFLDEEQLLLAIAAFQECEENELKRHRPQRAEAFGKLADVLIAAGQKAV